MAELETVKQGDTEVSETGTQEEKRFTQEEVNKMISARVNEVRGEYKDYEKLKKIAEGAEELNKANPEELEEFKKRAADLEAELESIKKADELRRIRASVSERTGIPADLLHGSDEEACTQEAEKLLKWAKPTYPTIKDAGEVPASPITREQIMAIKNDKARAKAIEEHIDLF